MKLETIRQSSRRPRVKTKNRSHAIQGFVLIALALLALPAAAAELFLPRLCGLYPPERGEEYCALFGLVPSQTDCRCVPEEPKVIKEGGLNTGHFGDGPVTVDLCAMPRKSAEELCSSMGMWFHPVYCQCHKLYLVPQIPDEWWNLLPTGLITWTEGKLLLHRGAGSFIVTDFESLSTAAPLALSGAGVEEIEAQGLAVVDAESLH